MILLFYKLTANRRSFKSDSGRPFEIAFLLPGFKSAVTSLDVVITSFDAVPKPVQRDSEQEPPPLVRIRAGFGRI